jgi:ABC-type antimicrobial peptide transport system permease subunit
MREQIRASVAPRRLTSQLVAGLGVIAMILAAIGIYGLFATAVIDRKREFAIRAALGAADRRLIQHVLGDSMRVGLLGIVLGFLGALMAGAWLRTMLYASDGREPMTLVIAAFTLLITTIVASLLPARRAARVPPATALRA